MTQDEIVELKYDIQSTVAARLEESFIGQSVTQVMLETAKNYLTAILKDILARRPGASIVETLDFDVGVHQGVLNVQVKPKAGLSDYDYRRAQAFIHNEAFFG